MPVLLKFEDIWRREIYINPEMVVCIKQEPNGKIVIGLQGYEVVVEQSLDSVIGKFQAFEKLKDWKVVT